MMPQMIPRGHAFSAAFGAGLGDLVEAMMPRYGEEGGDEGAGGGEADDAEDQAGDAEAVGGAAASRVVPSMVKGMPQPCSCWRCRAWAAVCTLADDDLFLVILADDFAGAFAGGGVGVDGVGVLPDDLARLGVDQFGRSGRDGDGDVVAAGGHWPSCAPIASRWLRGGWSQ